MTVIHAYRRREGVTVELYGVSIEFKPNAAQDVVAEVEHEEAVVRLLSIREAYRQYIDRSHITAIEIAPGAVTTSRLQTPADEPAKQADAGGASERKAPGESRSPYVFANDAGETIDISDWTAAQIRTFAESNEITLPKGSSVKVGELRDLLAAALRAGSKE